MSDRTAWHATIQENNNPGDDHDEVLTLEGVRVDTDGATIEGTDGRRITFVEPAGESDLDEAA